MTTEATKGEELTAADSVSLSGIIINEVRERSFPDTPIEIGNIIETSASPFDRVISRNSQPYDH